MFAQVTEYKLYKCLHKQTMLRFIYGYVFQSRALTFKYTFLNY